MNPLEITAIALPFLAMVTPDKFKNTLLWLPFGVYVFKQMKDQVVALPEMPENKKEEFQKKYDDLL